MITFLNRVELLRTTDMNRYSRIRDLLAEHRIEYKTKVQTAGSVRSLGNNRMMPMGRTVRENRQEFAIFVRKDDAEQSSFLLNNANRL
ncbi:MAG: hypothetical protein IJ130_01765 [Solobacterium sp.]|nr:hypothetical protein [Solobacterium sp.]